MPEAPQPRVAAMVVHCARVLQRRPQISTALSGLVIGCGNGDEVIYLRRALGAKRIWGLDVAARFSSLARAENSVFTADAQSLPFRCEIFDFASSFHSLEHVGDAPRALDEIQRVLRPGGWFYVGVPNRSRVIGYLGSFDATPWQKLSWNFIDWWARLRGEFENQSGAHAGFDRSGFVALLEQRFSTVKLITEEFLRFKYRNRLPRPVLDFLLSPGMINYSVPAHYALCKKAV